MEITGEKGNFCESIIFLVPAEEEERRGTKAEPKPSWNEKLYAMR